MGVPAQYLTSEARVQFERDGLVVLPSLLSASEVSNLRDVSAEYLKKNAVFIDGGATQMDAFRHIPGIRWLPTHTRVLEAFS